jgi:hypothetical protein
MGVNGFGSWAGRDGAGRFGPGNPGRPRGSRNRRTHQLAMALLEDFHFNEEDNLNRMRQWFFADYLRLMGRLLPRRVMQVGPDFADYSAEETAMVVKAGRAALDRIERGEAGLDALLAVLEADPATLEPDPETLGCDPAMLELDPATAGSCDISNSP